MKVKDLMTPNPIYCSSNTSLSKVAQLMRDEDFGEIPVCANERVIGVVTDRDIVCRTIAEDKDPLRMTAGDIMSRLVVTTSPEDELEDAIEIMEEDKVRRLPVVDQEWRLVGILSASDVSAVSAKKAGKILRAASASSLWKSKTRVA